MPEKVLSHIKPRKYQQEIYENCKDKNCLVVLPTGIGKTLIGLMLSIYTQKKFPGTKTLFLAPTRPLAEQHLAYFKKHLPELFAQLTLFTGKTAAEKRQELWESSDIIFSTPQCISNDLRNNLYNLDEVSLLIEDECHRCLKNYSYTYISQKYKEQGKNQRILGLTASPGTDKDTIKQIAKNLGIEAIELRTRDSVDVKEYLQELEFIIRALDFPQDLREIVSIIKILYQRKTDELKNRKLLFGPPTKFNLLKLQSTIMASISKGNRNFNLLSGASAAAQAIKFSHLIELLETQTLYNSLNYMKSMFQQAAENKSKAVKQIVKNKEFNCAYIKLNELIARNTENPKLIELKNIIKESIRENPRNKTIVFSQYRDTVSKIAEELNKIKGINAKIFVGQTKKAGQNGIGSGTGLSQKEQQQIIEEFKIGTVNIIAATSIAEEGLDIPEVNSVIFYEPIPSAIRKIQRAGRTARLMKGKLIILLNKGTLDEIYYYAAIGKEKRMYNSIESIKNDLDNGVPLETKEDKEKQEKLNKLKETQEKLF
jgi:ERCC4-related helicase